MANKPLISAYKIQTNVLVVRGQQDDQQLFKIILNISNFGSPSDVAKFTQISEIYSFITTFGILILRMALHIFNQALIHRFTMT